MHSSLNSLKIEISQEYLSLKIHIQHQNWKEVKDKTKKFWEISAAIS